ncbi:MAG: cupin domain-containing protein [Desulfuromonadales bacterium]|nr:cupin domain-containing protein [Desulfuromonadales bacterium]NIR33325.1 cupin domain-containing protein [Desulfuromonadales bacterium]NIS42111.1 cupin domain-containing protein [Desulfuromonadales bacterium]
MKTIISDYEDKIAFDREKATKVLLSQTDMSRATLWCLMPGQSIEPHIHDGDHIWVVLEGEGRLTNDEEETGALSPGIIASIPSGHAHGAENTGQQGLVFVSISIV